MMPSGLRAIQWLTISSLLLGCQRTPEVAQSEAKAEARDAATPRGEGDAKAAAKGEAKTEAEAKTEGEAKGGADGEAEAKVEPPEPVPPRSALFFHERPKQRLKVSLLPEVSASDPAPRELGIVADDNGGSVDYGTTTPVLSGDGQWLAFIDDGRLEVARVDGSERHRITEHPASKVAVSIAGFSPDSASLLYHQGEVQTEEGAELPEGVVPGFHQLTLADRAIEPRTSLEAFTAFVDDEHVIFARRLDDRTTTALVRVHLRTAAEEELQRDTGSFAYSQLTVHGDRIAYSRSVGDTRSVVTSALDGGGLVTIASGGSFAQYQWPHFSLDGRFVAYTDETNLMVRGPDDPAPRVLHTCTERHCDQAWDSATSLLVLDQGTLSRVGLDGTATPLATDVVSFAMAGSPG